MFYLIELDDIDGAELREDVRRVRQAIGEDEYLQRAVCRLLAHATGGGLDQADIEMLQGDEEVTSADLVRMANKQLNMLFGPLHPKFLLGG